MVLESMCHEQSCFVTLTYNDDYLPADGSLKPEHSRNWLKRFRKGLGDERVRYFLVGEYGDASERPHYHACLFGQGIERSALITSSWGMGFCMAAEFNHHTAAYTAGYVVKKLTARDDIRLNGRHPEFARMSNRPGIGALAMRFIAEQLDSPVGREELVKLGDVPHQLKMGKQSIPLGRYLRSKLRSEVGMTDAEVQEAKDKFSWEKSREMLHLLRDALDVEPLAPHTTKSAYVNSIQGRIWSVEARSKLTKGKKL